MPAWINAKEGPGAAVMDVLRQPTVRKVLPFVVIFMLLMSVAVFFTSMKPTPYRPLVLMLSDADKQQAIEALKAAEFKPEVDVNTGQISVPTARFQEARMLLASKGLPTHRSVWHGQPQRHARHHPTAHREAETAKAHRG